MQVVVVCRQRYTKYYTISLLAHRDHHRDGRVFSLCVCSALSIFVRPNYRATGSSN